MSCSSATVTVTNVAGPIYTAPTGDPVTVLIAPRGAINVGGPTDAPSPAFPVAASDRLTVDLGPGESIYGYANVSTPVDIFVEGVGV